MPRFCCGKDADAILSRRFGVRKRPRTPGLSLRIRNRKTQRRHQACIGKNAERPRLRRREAAGHVSCLDGSNGTIAASDTAQLAATAINRHDASYGIPYMAGYTVAAPCDISGVWSSGGRGVVPPGSAPGGPAHRSLGELGVVVFVVPVPPVVRRRL